jgi:hypothetical protein
MLCGWNSPLPAWSRRVIVSAVRAIAFVGLACTACGIPALCAQDTTRIDFARNVIGAAPADFEFARTGEGELGQWSVVRDPTAGGGLAIEHVSTDQRDERFSLAIYRPLKAENVEVSVRFKIISGTIQTAGVALCVRNPGSYYAIAANAFEHRIDLLLFSNGKSERIDGAEAEVTLDRWHALAVTVNDDHFAVSLDKKLLFTTFDRARMKDGRVALWAQEDNVTRFDELEIRALPATEWR